MDDYILITELNDFIFCPCSIYFHKLYGNMDRMLYQTEYQLKGTKSHETVDNKSYGKSSDIITALDVCSNQYKVTGKIDIYNRKTKTLTERKRQIKVVYDGYIFQLYAQYFSMLEMGYDVQTINLHSMVDNKYYPVKLPEKDNEMLHKFEDLLDKMRSFDMSEDFVQNNVAKCKNCIYEPACDRSGLDS